MTNVVECGILCTDTKKGEKQNGKKHKEIYNEKRKAKKKKKEYKQIRAKSDKGREWALHLPRLEEKDIFVGRQDGKGDNEGDGEQALDILDIYKVCDRVLLKGDRE